MSKGSVWHRSPYSSLVPYYSLCTYLVPHACVTRSWSAGM